MPAAFDTFFRAATGLHLTGEATATQAGNTPYGYQCRLACGERNGRPEAEWLTGGTACKSQLIDIPTGLGRLAAQA